MTTENVVVVVTEADREAVQRLIGMASAAKAEGMPIADCHDFWRYAFARHRIDARAAAIAEERARIIANIRGIASITRLISPVESKILTQMANAIEVANPPEAEQAT